jgi:23S rRNA pseudouridine1911/1915/1917 synthase
MRELAPDRINYYRVTENLSVRLDLYLAQKIKSISRSKISQWIREAYVSVNEQKVKPGLQLKAGDLIGVRLPVPELARILPVEMNLTILYEDDRYLALNKPKGLVVHPGAGNLQGTLVSGLLHYTEQLSTVGGAHRPGLVHRLDKDTTGVLIIAKDDDAHWKLGNLFSERKVYKEYRALVWGTPEPAAGVIEQAIGRSPVNRQKFIVTANGKFARTRYAVLRASPIISELKAILETGRTHQIRIHLSYLGHPVVGDQLYGGKNRSLINLAKKYQDLGKQVLAQTDRQLLHAYRLRFLHPMLKKEIEITAPIPEDFKAIQSLLWNSELI